MQSDPADQASKTGYSRLWVAGLVLCVLAGIVFLALRDTGTEITPPGNNRPPTSNGVTTREDLAGELLNRLAADLADGTRREVVRLAAPGNRDAARSVAAILDNVRALGIKNLSFRYVDEDGGRLSTAENQALGGKAWVADVQVGWRISEFEKAPSQMEVSFTFVQTPEGVVFVSAGDQSAGDEADAAPLWLLTKLAVEESRRALVMTADASQLEQFAGLADRAVADVKQVLPDWRGRLVVEVPGSQDQLNHLLGTKPDTYDAIAAVTSTVDGSLSPSSPAHIFVNPNVFNGLGQTGSQIVISHEATHVATDAATSSMDMWLLEGFADYVALAHVNLPVSVTASQILGQVRRDGPPSHLPSGREFDPSNKALGASYESAWLACRFIAERYGERQLIALYNQVDTGQPIEQALKQVLDTNQKMLTGDWQNYLRQLAS